MEFTKLQHKIGTRYKNQIECNFIKTEENKEGENIK